MTEKVEVLLIGGPEQGRVVDLEPDEVWYGIGDISSRKGHLYIIREVETAYHTWYIGVHTEVQTDADIIGLLLTHFAKTIPNEPIEGVCHALPNT